MTQTFLKDRNIITAIVMPSLVLLSSVCTPAALSDVGMAEQHNRFDGSQFGPPTFRDDLLGKHMYAETVPRTSQPLDKLEKDVVRVGETRVGKRKSEEAAAPTGEIDQSISSMIYGHEYAQHFTPTRELTGDWVPDKIDLTSAGAFSIAPFNGSPVPYTLNGHVDPQRGKPWEEHE
jgi:hypothetical protein